MSKKILLLGGSGALGSYLTPELLKTGCRVHVVSLDALSSDDPNLTYEQADAKDNIWLAGALKARYDAIVDFMIYTTKEFKLRYEMLLAATPHYVFLSSYRVYADAKGVIDENSPRLLDTLTDDPAFLATDDYALAKARQEDILRASGYSNYTILRPVPTFSSRKYQLISMEANSFINRALEHKTVVLPEPAMHKQATMNWSGDVAKMVARLILNPKAYGQTYAVATAEHHTWGEIADYYGEILGMRYVTTDIDTFLNIFDKHTDWGRWRLMYDRMYDRVIDNGKILRDTGLTQADLMPLRDALRLELSTLPEDPGWCHFSVASIIYADINRRMDEFVATGKVTL